MERQLAEHQPAAGSDLERLIARNQEFHLLRPEEANDKLGIAPWLRVHWRKANQTVVATAEDPTGGYPRALKNIQNHLLALHSAKRKVVAVAAKAKRKAAAPGANRRISGAKKTPRSECDIRVNFRTPKQIIAASNAIGGDGHQAQYYSSTGGVTWHQTSLPLVDGDTMHSDPTVDWTSEGTAWATTIGIEGQNTLRMRAYKSTDGGKTWVHDAILSGAQTNADKQMMWIDHSPTSPFMDNIYVIWHDGSPAFVNRRTGPTGAWQTPLRVSGVETTGTAIGGDIKTNAFGEVFAF